MVLTTGDATGNLDPATYRSNAMPTDPVTDWATYKPTRKKVIGFVQQAAPAPRVHKAATLPEEDIRQPDAACAWLMATDPVTRRFSAPTTALLVMMRIAIAGGLRVGEIVAGNMCVSDISIIEAQAT